MPLQEDEETKKKEKNPVAIFRTSLKGLFFVSIQSRKIYIGIHRQVFVSYIEGSCPSGLFEGRKRSSKNRIWGRGIFSVFPASEVLDETDSRSTNNGETDDYLCEESFP